MGRPSSDNSSLQNGVDISKDVWGKEGSLLWDYTTGMKVYPDNSQLIRNTRPHSLLETEESSRFFCFCFRSKVTDPSLGNRLKRGQEEKEYRLFIVKTSTQLPLEKPLQIKFPYHTVTRHTVWISASSGGFSQPPSRNQSSSRISRVEVYSKGFMTFNLLQRELE